jgi:hypothetical protein
MTRDENWQAIWHLFSGRFTLPSYANLMAKGGPVDWVRLLSSRGNKTQKITSLHLLFTLWWNVWKGRNRRIFDHKECSVPQLYACILEQLVSYARAGILIPDGFNIQM